MLDKTKFNDNQKKSPSSQISWDIFEEEEKYKYMWEKMLKIEQLKKDKQKQTTLRLVSQKLN